MKMNIRLLMAAAIATSVTFMSCKKTDTPSNENNTELSTHADDQARIAGETDEVANDANSIIESYDAFNGRPPLTTENLLCNGTSVLDSNGTTRTITITYNGNNCYGTRSRTGIVSLSMPINTHWRDAGAVLTVNIQNLKVTRLRDNKSITINGTSIITNVTGGRLRDLAGLGNITHTIVSPGLTVTFDNGSQRTWQVAKERNFSYNNGVVISTKGTHTDGTISGISEWGTNRFGNSFVTSIVSPIVIRQDCDFRIVSGQVRHERLIVNTEVTFGLDATGAIASCPGNTGVYYFKMVWTGTNGIVRTVILPY